MKPKPPRGDEPKPIVPIRIGPQKCWTCGTLLAEGTDAIAHRWIPVAFCVTCEGENEKKSNNLCKAKVGKE